MFIGKKILITAGPTYEAIDPVRFIGNRSSGKMGFALALELAQRGAEIYLVAGPVFLKIDHPSVKRIDVESASEMYEQCIHLFPDCDIAILAAAVADFTPSEKSEIKIKKHSAEGEFLLKLVKTKDILASLGKSRKNNQLLIGFSLETDNEIANARKKLESKNLDFIVMNSLRDSQSGFNFNTNKITILDKNGHIISFELKNKKEVAVDIIDYLEKYMSENV